MNTTITNKKYHGSALILVVALVTLIAAIGTLFMMSMRLDHTAAISVSESKQLDAAVGSAVAKVAEQLYRDMDINTGSYYDYPDDNNPWLASLQPTPDEEWMQISDVTGYLRRMYGQGAYRDVDVMPTGLDTNTYVRDYPEGLWLEQYQYGLRVAGQGSWQSYGVSADASGDGIADSKWIVLDDTTADGQPILAAIRVIDHGGMLNVNTGYLFDPEEVSRSRIDGRSPTQINVAAADPNRAQTENYRIAAEELQFLRRPDSSPDEIDDRTLIWRYYQPRGPGDLYLPFDISDELELRNRFMLNSPVRTRVEEFSGFSGGWRVPRSSSNGTFSEWIDRITDPDNSF